jgi:predicted AlkP superfamily pyrophosphatase or phosphodiesterase
MLFKFIGHKQDAADALAAAQQHIDDVDVLFLYDCTVDHAGHSYGPELAAVMPHLDRVAATIEAIRELYESRHALETLVFSDHGMTAVENPYDIFAALMPLRIGRDFLAFPDSTFARFWYPSEGARDEVRSALRDAPGSFLTETEATRYGVPYPDDRYGDDVLIANEGVVFHPSYISPTFFRTSFPDKGMHGYRPECPSADGAVLYSGKVLDGELSARVPAEMVFVLMSTILAAIAT